MSFLDSLKQSLVIYKNNFLKLFIPLTILQLIIFFPVVIFTMPGILVASHYMMFFLTNGLLILNNIAMVLGAVALFAIFTAPYIISHVAYVVGYEHPTNKVTLKECLKAAKKGYKPMLLSYLAVVVLALPIALILFILQVQLGFEIGQSITLDTSLILPTVFVVLIVLLFAMGIAFLPFVVIHENLKGFKAVFKSFKYIYLGNFFKNFVKMLFGMLIMGGLLVLKNFISTLPFGEVFKIYLQNPAMTFFNEYFSIAVFLVVITIIITALVLPFWYTFLYNTYKSAKIDCKKERN